VGLTTIPRSGTDYLEIWESQPSGTLRASPGIALPLPLTIHLGALARKFVYNSANSKTANSPTLSHPTSRKSSEFLYLRDKININEIFDQIQEPSCVLSQF
jgi:hypothetical protein